MRSEALTFVVQFDQLSTKGNFDRVDIVTALTTHKGNVDLAFQELNGLQRQQFLHQVWNKQPEEAQPPPEMEKNVDMEVHVSSVNLQKLRNRSTDNDCILEPVDLIL